MRGIASDTESALQPLPAPGRKEFLKACSGHAIHFQLWCDKPSGLRLGFRSQRVKAKLDEQFMEFMSYTAVLEV
jgi:hypothetical protein